MKRSAWRYLWTAKEMSVSIAYLKALSKRSSLLEVKWKLFSHRLVSKELKK